MSITPESDSNILSIDCDDSCIDTYVRDKNDNLIIDDIVSINLSRKLEIERNNAREALNKIAELYEKYQYGSNSDIIGIAYDMRCIAREALIEKEKN